VEKLQKTDLYPQLFLTAFGDTSITGEFILKALSQFQLTLVSTDSKYDQMKRGELKFNEQEEKGYALFLKNCNSCHAEPLFSNYSFANNGLPIDSTLNDFGKIRISKNSADSLLFKIPSLRNLSFTYPYMHDGRFKKLSHVLNHYNNNIVQSKTLAKQLKKPMNLSSNDRVDLIAFLLTLNDKNFVFDKKHQFPKELFSIN